MSRSARLAAFSAPPITAVALLYHVLADLQVTVLRRDTLAVIGLTLALAMIGGALAAFAGARTRAIVLSIVAVLWVDMAFGLSRVFDELAPERRAVNARDRKRLRDVATIQAALEDHITRIGPLPMPPDYREGIGPSNFWEGWWDVSSEDTNGDGLYFLDFLVKSEVMTEVPLDPLNLPASDRDPTRGSQYTFFVVPAGYAYRGGQCPENAGYSTYLLGVTDLERETDRPPSRVSGSGCDCLWRERPNFFQHYFDYVVCGRFKP